MRLWVVGFFTIALLQIYYTLLFVSWWAAGVSFHVRIDWLIDWCTKTLYFCISAYIKFSVLHVCYKLYELNLFRNQLLWKSRMPQRRNMQWIRRRIQMRMLWWHLRNILSISYVHRNNILRFIRIEGQTAQSTQYNIRHAGRGTTATTQGSTIYGRVKPAKLLPHTAHSDWINRTGLTSGAFTRWCDRHTSDKVAHYSVYRPRKHERLSWPWVAGYIPKKCRLRESNPDTSPIQVLTGLDVE